MKLAKDYDSVMGRSADIMKASLGLDFNDFESGSVAFDYEGLMKATGYTIEEVDRIQSRTGVGHTQLLELRNITALARKYAKPVMVQESSQRTRLQTHPVLSKTDVQHVQ